MPLHIITHLISRGIHRYLVSRVLDEPRITIGSASELYFAPSLKWPASILMGTVVGAFSYGAWQCLQETREDPSKYGLAALLLIPILWMTYVIILMFSKRVVFDFHGVTLQRLPGLRRRIDWAEITNYSYSKLLTTHVFQTLGKRSIRLPIVMSGLPVFFQVMAERAPQLSEISREAAAKQRQALAELGHMEQEPAP